jgi:hypothetical protein
MRGPWYVLPVVIILLEYIRSRSWPRVHTGHQVLLGFTLWTSAPTSQYWCLHVQHTVIQYYSTTVTCWEHLDWYGMTSKAWNRIGSLNNRNFIKKIQILMTSFSCTADPGHPEVRVNPNISEVWWISHTSRSLVRTIAYRSSTNASEAQTGKEKMWIRRTDLKRYTTIK